MAERDVRLEAVEAGVATKAADPVDVFPAGRVREGRRLALGHLQICQLHHQVFMQVGERASWPEPQRHGVCGACGTRHMRSQGPVRARQPLDAGIHLIQAVDRNELLCQGDVRQRQWPELQTERFTRWQGSAESEAPVGEGPPWQQGHINGHQRSRHGLYASIRGVTLRVLRAALLAVLACLPSAALAEAPISYRLSFPAPEQHWMQVDATFAELPAAPLQLRISRTSPGRYAAHEFARNVDEVRVRTQDGQPLPVTRAGTHGWDVPAHGAVVHVSYRVYGNTLDGTYLAIDDTHAHINMPAAILWARGLEQRQAEVRFVAPPGRHWTVATQLLPGAEGLTFTAPNLPYLMDSPAEFGTHTVRRFEVPDGARTASFRLAVHHDGPDDAVADLQADVEKLVREARAVFGGFPAFEGGSYTFLADALPWSRGDGMEHRNSTVITSAAALVERWTWRDLVAHEFFHAWNVERIRPRSLEPFNLEEVSLPTELWLAEGFNNYYGPLLQHRAGLMTTASLLDRLQEAVNAVLTSPGRRTRSVEDMSRLAALVDGATRSDRGPDYAYLSYYTWGSAIGLALDLALRDRSDGAITLDTFMRELWLRFGQPGNAPPGVVARPYTTDDVESTLATVSGDAAFAHAFIAEYVRGHGAPDFTGLLTAVGLRPRLARPGGGTIGPLSLDSREGGVRISSAVAPGTPAAEGGLSQDDILLTLAGRRMTTPEEVEAALAASRPGIALPVTFRRRGVERRATLRPEADPTLTLVTDEAAGGTLSPRQQRLRAGWLGR